MPSVPRQLISGCAQWCPVRRVISCVYSSWLMSKKCEFSTIKGCVSVLFSFGE